MEIEFNFDDFSKYITDKAGQAALKTLGDTLGDATKSGSKFLVEQSKLTSKYIKMRKEEEITPEEFESLIKDLNTALEAELLRMNLSARQAGQKLLKSFADILGGALSVLIKIK